MEEGCLSLNHQPSALSLIWEVCSPLEFSRTTHKLALCCAFRCETCIENAPASPPPPSKTVSCLPLPGSFLHDFAKRRYLDLKISNYFRPSSFPGSCFRSWDQKSTTSPVVGRLSRCRVPCQRSSGSAPRCQLCGWL